MLTRQEARAAICTAEDEPTPVAMSGEPRLRLSHSRAHIPSRSRQRGRVVSCVPHLAATAPAHLDVHREDPAQQHEATGHSPAAHDFCLSTADHGTTAATDLR